MINTVPKTVPLSDVIGPRKWITIYTFLDLTSTGAVSYSGAIGTYSKTPVPAVASYQYNTEGGGNTGPKTSSAGGKYTALISVVILADRDVVLQPYIINNTTSDGLTFIATRFPFFGNTTFYSFTDVFNSPTIQSITVQGTYTEAINLSLFVVPSLSFVNGGTVLIRAAVSASSSLP